MKLLKDKYELRLVIESNVASGLKQIGANFTSGHRHPEAIAEAILAGVTLSGNDLSAEGTTDIVDNLIRILGQRAFGGGGELWQSFLEEVQGRLRKGEAEYKDNSPSRSPEELDREIMEEQLDQVGWTFQKWRNLEIKRRMRAGKGARTEQWQAKNRASH